MSDPDAVPVTSDPDPGLAFTSDAALGGEIFALTEYAVPNTRSVREFQAWHKPRKQYVRRNQWAAEIEWLLSRRGNGDRDLRYLGLPGADLLDIRYIYMQFCDADDRILTFLGLDPSARRGARLGESLNVSLQEVRSLRHVNPQSDVIGDDFRRLADSASIAWDRATELGPFDIVNIDLCGHLAHDSPDLDESIYNAIHALLGLQARQARPWSIFLTSRISRDEVSPATLDVLLARITENVASCLAFVDSFIQTIGVGLEPLDVGAWDDRQFFSVLVVGLAKWLLGLAQAMRNELSVSSVTAYRVLDPGGATDMVSIVLRFEPQLHIAPDPSGLATNIPSFESECAQAEKIPLAVAALVDLDEVLSADATLWHELREETAEILTLARYDPGQYRAWTDQQLAQANPSA